MSNIKKADESTLHSLHYATAAALKKLLKEEKDPEMILKILREARGFLKDNNVTADIEHTPVVRQVEAEVNIAELPFEVEDDNAE